MKDEMEKVVPILLVFAEQDRFCARQFFSHPNAAFVSRTTPVFSDSLDGLRSKIRKDRTRYDGGPCQALETWV